MVYGLLFMSRSPLPSYSAGMGTPQLLCLLMHHSSLPLTKDWSLDPEEGFTETDSSACRAIYDNGFLCPPIVRILVLVLFNWDQSARCKNQLEDLL